LWTLARPLLWRWTAAAGRSNCICGGKQMTRLLALATGWVAAVTPAIVVAQPVSAPHPASAAETGAPGTATRNKNPVDPTSLAVARQILTIAFPPEKRAKMYDSMMRSIVDQSFRNMDNLGTPQDKDFQKLVDRGTRRMFDRLTAIMIASLPDYYESMAHAYARLLSRDDLDALLAFVKTPAGEHYFDRVSSILKDPDVQAAGQRVVAQMMDKAPEITREQKRDIDEYVATRAKQGKPLPTLAR
jgi:hypothetical protein